MNITNVLATRLNHMGLAGLGGQIQAALQATTGWHFKQARLLCRSKDALGRALLHILPVKNNTH